MDAPSATRHGRRTPDGSWRATRIGSLAAAALAKARRGTVAGVHARALNVTLDDGAVVTLLPAGTPLHPFALVVDRHATAFAAGVADLAGVAVQAGGRALQLGHVQVEWGTAETVDLRLRIRPGAVPRASTQAVLAEVLPKAANEDPFEAPIAAALADFAHGGDPAGLLQLVGLGQGFTPAGDDVLVGVLAGLDLLGEASAAARTERVALAGTLRVSLASRTAQLAAQMLSAALEGQYPGPLLQVLDALGRGQVLEPAHPALRALASMGQRSGQDTLRGLLAVISRHQAA